MNYYRLWWLVNEAIRVRTTLIQKSKSGKIIKEAQEYNQKAIPLLKKLEDKLHNHN